MLLRIEVGTDVSEILGIVKWEAPEDAGTTRNAKGSFPAFIQKTDQNYRLQEERVDTLELISGTKEKRKKLQQE